MPELSDSITRKFVDSIDISDWEIETDTGWHDISAIHKTVEYQEWVIVTETGKSLICADTHIIFTESMDQIFVKDCIPGETSIITKSGPERVISVYSTKRYSNMFDVSVDSPTHRLYTNDILSHNTTAITVLVLWYIIFHEHKHVAILANKGETAREILSRIQLAYEHLPKWLQQGVVEWNKGSFELENGSKVMAAATGSSTIRGFSVNLLLVDEAAFVENFDDFFAGVFPTISSGQSTKVILVSTVNGLNHFYKITTNARNHKNGYHLISVPWWEVPGRDEAWKQETLAAMNFDNDKFAAEFENQYLGSSGTLIAGWKLKELVDQIPILQKEGIKQYKLPVSGHKYACVADVSRGKGLDYSAFSIIDVTKMPYDQVMVYKSNLITPIEYAEIIHRFCKLYNNALLLIESNDIGEQVASVVYYDYEYTDMLFTENHGRIGKQISSGFSGRTSDLGIRTTKGVKNVGCSMIKLLIEQNQFIVNDFDTIHEFSVFSKNKQSYEAEPGNNDDIVMGLVLFGWLTNQSFFKEYTEINTLDRLRDRSDEELMNDLVPFGIIDTGPNEDKDDDDKPPVQKTWLDWNIEPINDWP